MHTALSHARWDDHNSLHYLHLQYSIVGKHRTRKHTVGQTQVAKLYPRLAATSESQRRGLTQGTEIISLYTVYTHTHTGQLEITCSD